MDEMALPLLYGKGGITSGGQYHGEGDVSE